MTEIRCIGMCSGGGDAPGLNAVIRPVKSAILKCHWKVIGIPDDFGGPIWPERSHEFTLKDVSGILPRGGTILGMTNCGNACVHGGHRRRCRPPENRGPQLRTGGHSARGWHLLRRLKWSVASGAWSGEKQAPWRRV